MITTIPEGQICEAFDPMMFLPEKTLNIIGITQNANPGCVAPAFVYIEGTHGKKFLCDFHYYYEANMTRSSSYRASADSWQDIQKYIVDEREKIKETFAKNVTTNITLGQKCALFNAEKPNISCTAEPLVCSTKKETLVYKQNFKNLEDFVKNYGVFFCNFHFRKNYYRYYSNGVRYEDIYEIIDERYRLNVTIAQEALNLNAV
jgi:hypothetical protein